MLKKSKLLLAFMPFMLVGCGGNTDCTAKRGSEIKNCTKVGSPTYLVMEYNLGIVEEKTKKVTCKDFSATVGNKKITADCLIDSITEYKSYNTYNNVVENVEVAGGTKSTWVNVGWETDSGITNDSKFYCKGYEITTTFQIIKI